MRDIIEAWKGFLFGLFIAGVVAFGAGYEVGWRMAEHSHQVGRP